MSPEDAEERTCVGSKFAEQWVNGGFDVFITFGISYDSAGQRSCFDNFAFITWCFDE